MPTLIRRHPMVAFFVLTLVLTWSIVPIGSFFAPGPLVAAIVVTAVVSGRAGLREWGSRLIRWRVHPLWYLVAVAVPLATLAAAAGSNMALGAPTGAVDRLDAWYVLIGTFAGRLVIPLMAPIGEEPGWRGFALPRLQANASPLRATLVLAPLVVLWHVPLIFLASEDLAPVLLVATFAVTFFYTWLYNRTGGSVLLAIVAHAAEGTIKLSAFGFVGVYDSRLPYLYTIAWSLVAVGLLVFDRRFWTGRLAVAPFRAVPAPAAQPIM